MCHVCELSTLCARVLMRVSVSLVLGVGLGCSRSTESPYPVSDTGTWVKGFPGQNIYWVDDEALIFTTTLTGRAPRAGKPGGWAVYRWRLGETPSLLKRDVLILCYGHRIAWEIEVRAGDDAYWSGEPGREEIAQPGRWFDEMNCRWRAEQPGESQARAVAVLLDGEGYLELGSSYPDFKRNAPVVLHRSGGRDPVALPFGRWDIHAPRYYAFRDAYFLDGQYFDDKTNAWVGDWPRAVRHRVWWLTSAGEVAYEDLPLGPWNEGGGSVLVAPVKTGYFVIYHGGDRSAKDPGKQGGYLVAHGKATKVLDGYILSPAVSPDGCRLAVAHAPSFFNDRSDENNRRTLKVIDFCKQGAES